MNGKMLILTKEKMTYIWAGLIILLGQISVTFKSDIILLFALAATVIISFIIDRKEMLPFVLCLIAPNRSLTLGPISAPTIIMMVGVLRSINGGKLKVSHKFIILSFSFILYCCLTVGIGEKQIMSGIKIIVVLIFIWIFWATDNIKCEYVKYVKSCSFGCIIAAVSALLINPSSISESSRFSIVENGGENVLGIICAIMTINLLCIFLEERKAGIGCLIISLFLVVIGLITGSRSFLISIAIGIIGIIVISILKLKVKQFIKIIFIVALAVGAGSLVLNVNEFLSNYMVQLLYRFNKLAGQDISNGRYELWNQYITVFKAHPIYFWFGNMNFLDLGIQYVAHNMIIEQIASIGVVGSTIAILIYMCTYKHVMQTSHTRIMIFTEKIVPLISFLVVGFVSHTLLGVPQTMLLYICGTAILQSREEKESI